MKNEDNKIMSILDTYISMGGTAIFNDFGSSSSSEKIDENDLGEGMRLVPVPKDELEEYSEEERYNYCYLYKGDEKLSEAFFRRGRFCRGFRYGYCELIEYVPNDRKSGSTHVIVNTSGEVVLESDTGLDNPSHIRGLIGRFKEAYYNLETGEILAKGKDTVESEDFLFVENRYNWDYEIERYGKVIPLGVYKICFKTGEVEYFKAKKK